MKFRVFYLTTTPGHHDYPEDHFAIVEACTEEEATSIAKKKLEELEGEEHVGTALILVKPVGKD